MTEGAPRGRIHLLRESVARQIAAGEVIDRPYSVVRELLDNAIDAGAAAINLYIEAGGIGAVRVVDTGSGMAREDLELCWQSHATSKIERLEDLDRLASLGFRGEALSSIAACSRLTITSRTEGAGSAYRLRVDSGKLVALEEAPGERGTIVEAADLFYSLPARRKFLKATSSETAMCRSTFVEKSLPFPSVAMRFSADRELKLFLPAVATLDERVAAAHPAIVRLDLLHRLDARAPSFSISVVMGGPSLYRRDRRYIWTYVNNRRINEYSLIQAVEYGFADHLPRGHFPIAFVFISVDPELVDFNVHPAKREVRFRNLPEIHHVLTSALKGYLGRFALRFDKPAREGTPQALAPGWEGSGARAVEGAQREGDREGGEVPTAAGEVREAGMHESGAVAPSGGWAARETRPYRSEPGGAPPRVAEGRFPASRPSPAPAGDAARRGSQGGELATRPIPPPADRIRYYGQTFGLFLIASVDERLFIIDQHAAHERILFERLRSGPSVPERLLVPIAFEATPDEEQLLDANGELCAAAGITLRKVGNGSWEVLALPEGFHSLEDEVIAFVKQARGTKRELEQELYARLACRAALKEGDAVDEITAVELIRQTFALEQARCPHGRPIWHELSRTELYRLVGRL